MSTVQPSPRTWTLRFKHHRTTVVVHADPLQKWSSIRSDLLKAIEQTHPGGEFNARAIPKNPDDILLARPIDMHDLAQGWLPLDSEPSDEDLNGKGKGKAKAGTIKSPASASARDCPAAAGLKDGSVLAFKFRSQTPRPGSPSDDTLGNGLSNDDAEQWDVVVPTLANTYIEQDAQSDSQPDEGIE